MQLVYLDEAGISNKAHEPHLVVAGVIVNPDQKWKDLERYFADFTAELFPEHVNVYGRHLIFHAKDIWHGSGKFDRSQWSREERMKILTRFTEFPNNSIFRSSMATSTEMRLSTGSNRLTQRQPEPRSRTWCNQRRSFAL